MFFLSLSCFFFFSFSNYFFSLSLVLSLSIFSIDTFFNTSFFLQQCSLLNNK